MPIRENVWLCRHRNLARHPLIRRQAEERDARVEVAGIFGSKKVPKLATWIGWGYKRSGLWALERGRQNGKTLLFEDGFVRSLKPGYTEGALYSLVEDAGGIYYDGAGNSDLVRGLEGESWIGESLEGDDWQSEAGRSLERFRDIGASKYNWYPGEFAGPEALENAMPTPGAVVIDQTRGDASIVHAKADAGDFGKMLKAALEETDGPVYVRSHPDHLFRKKHSCFSPGEWKDQRIRVIPATLAPWQTFSRATRVFVVSSLLGLEALIHEVPVSVFGCAFYSGWGLTDDRHPHRPKRSRSRTLPELFQAAYGLYSRYFDPHFNEPCDLGTILDHLDLQKNRFRENARKRVIFGMHPWKRPIVKRFLRSPASPVHWARTPRKAKPILEKEPDADLVVWGRQEVPAAWSRSHRIIRSEDGFIRSAGLGAAFHEPLSLVFDNAGIYYDAGQPSELETILETTEFSEAECRTARTLIDSLTSAGVTKYNLPKNGETATWPRRSGAAPRILVPGQVEADASIAFGCSTWKTNAELLQAVRERHPNAAIAYKPHPDVVGRLRNGRVFPEKIEALCDAIVTDLTILPWLESCDAVHTLTSLSGFEALLRGKPVTCYGTPFYSGWGLTDDIAAKPDRRHRNLTLEQLVAGALVRYPRYAHPETGEFMNPDAAVRLLARGGASPFARPWHLRLLARLKRLIVRR